MRGWPPSFGIGPHAISKHPEAVNQGITGSLRDSLDVPSLSLQSAPCPLGSGPVRRGGSGALPPSRTLWFPSFPEIPEEPANGIAHSASEVHLGADDDH